jgi:D-xylose 1-dehydrogenase (NADP+, D-xylono-1,5-lactone-forming)
MIMIRKEKMTDTELRWGLLSTAHINRVVIPPLMQSKRNHLVAVASRNKQKADAYAAEWKIPKTYGAYEELLSDPEIDVIYNPLPNSMHAAWTIKALEAGKHVLCEKPLATKLEDVDAIISAANKTGKVVAEAFMYRHHPQTLKVKELIKQNAIGKVVLMRGAFTFNLTNQRDIRMNPALGGGSIWDVGCYPISYARFMYGLEPFQVLGFQVDSSTGVDLSFSGEMKFLGDMVAQFQSSFWSPSYNRFEIFGEKGQIIIPEPFKPGRKEKFSLFQNGAEKEIETESGDLYEGEIEDIADAILNHKPPRISLADSRNNVRTIVNLLESAKTGAVV